jgi:hypothetical protein
MMPSTAARLPNEGCSDGDVEMNPVILFVFAGRRPNLELQLPLIRKILEKNPNVEYHVWNLARDNGDSKYLQTIEGDRITVFNEYRQFSPGYDMVYKHYKDEQFKDHMFVKLDDDVVFLQTARFKQFFHAINAHPEAIISANVVNNGACTPLEPQLWEKFKRIGMPLLDVHKSAGYAGVAHNYFFDHYHEMLDHDIELVRTDDWLSINAIGYTWEMNNEFARLTGTRCRPQNIAGRDLNWLSDEGTANMFPRIIMKGFLACHLTFGPQNLTTTQLMPWRQRYTEIAAEYLNTDWPPSTGALPLADYVSHGQRDKVNGGDWRERWAMKTADRIDQATGNDPTVGRFTL